MQQQIKVLAFAGSLRKGSYNKALIRTAVKVAPPTVSIEVFDLEGNTAIQPRLRKQSVSKS